MNNQLPYDVVIQKKFDAKYGEGKFIYTPNTYEKGTRKAEITCVKHNTSYTKNVSNMLRSPFASCPSCNKEYSPLSMTTIDFLKKAYERWGDRFDYSKVECINSFTPVVIICREHGEFSSSPNSHFNKQVKHSCPICAKRSQINSSKLDWRSKRRELEIAHPNIDWSKIEYTGKHTVYHYDCSCGRQLHKSISNIEGTGIACYWCDNSSQPVRSLRDFIEKSNSIYESGRFNYDKSKFSGIQNEVTNIYCNDCKSYFDVKPYNHFKYSETCPSCRISRGEKRIQNYLEFFNIPMSTQYIFENCRFKRVLPFDIAIYDGEDTLKLLIEYDGEQHYRPVSFGSHSYSEVYNRFLRTINYDDLKNKYCEDNKIPLLRIPYWRFNNIEEVLERELPNYIRRNNE